MTRVLTVDLNHEAVAYPYDVLSQLGAINENIGGETIVIFWAEGTASALDTSAIPEGRDIGAAVAYSRQLDETTLTFKFTEIRLPVPPQRKSRCLQA